MTTNTITPEAPAEDVETPAEEVETPPEGDTFPRDYVEKLREESAGHRTRAKAAEEALAPTQQRLHAALVAATGRLADPSDLPFDAAHLEDEAALTSAIDALIEGKPHLASRRVVGDVGQGAGGDGSPGEVDLGGMMRSRA